MNFARVASLLVVMLSHLVWAGVAEWQVHFDAGASAQQRGDYRSASSHLEAALREAEIFGANDLRLASSLNSLALAYKAIGRLLEAEPLYRRSLAIHEMALGGDHPNVALVLNNLALLYRTQGRYELAEPLYRRSLVILQKTHGAEHPDIAGSLNNLAEMLDGQGRMPEAERLFRQALTILEKGLSPNDLLLGQTLNNLAALHSTQGRYAESERLRRRSLDILDKALGPNHPEFGVALNNLAALYVYQGRHAEAVPLLRRALDIKLKAFGPNHPGLAATMQNLATAYRRLGRFAQAEQLYRRALAINERALGLEDSSLGALLDDLASMQHLQGKFAEAEQLYRRSLSLQTKAPGSAPQSVAKTLNGLGMAAYAQGRYAEAEPLYFQALDSYEKALGPEHPSLGTVLGNLAALYIRQQRWRDGLAVTRRATRLLALRFTGDDDVRGTLAEQQTYAKNFELQLGFLTRSGEDTATAAAEGFAVAQLARGSDTAEQVANMAARHAAGSDALAQLARARQDLIARLRGLDARVVQGASRAAKDRDAPGEAQLRTDAADARKALGEIDARLGREYPKYQELTDPKPLEMVAAQKLLNEDEALVLLLATGSESYLWALTRGQAGFFKLTIKRGEMAATVKRLRAQLDLGAGDAEQMIAQPFDVAAAHNLYRQIFAPAEKLLEGVKHLIFVPDGPMQSLPPGVLVSDAPAKPTAGMGEHGDVAWLAKKYAITVLPAASTLRALRQFARPPSSGESFGGFGAPVLAGKPGAVRGVGVAALYSRGAVADANEVRKLEPLPESADELRAIALALNAPASSVRLGAAATERAVKEADLRRYRTLAFATHGLMAGEFKGLGEPALVLTPPPVGSTLDDGLLTASEISQLKLDADLVVLSACNTAAPDGTPGAEGLSGLARAFFYAGARSLLVSHWAVSSEAAVALTTRMFEETAKGATKAEAMRRSMLSMMRTPGRQEFAHPALWAPFVVVGEGGAPMK